ncbi:MAG: hypothetical protein ACOCRX_08720 [Candidatus Woesearchaeota archaeon]
MRCKKCCYAEEEYYRQFPTTLYEGIKCDICGKEILKENGK